MCVLELFFISRGGNLRGNELLQKSRYEIITQKRTLYLLLKVFCLRTLQQILHWCHWKQVKGAGAGEEFKRIHTTLMYNSNKSVGCLS